MSDNNEKKRGPRGPRDTFFACFATKGKQDIAESVKADTKEKADSLFEKEQGVKARAILGPFYEVKGTGQSPSAKMFIKLKDVMDMQQTSTQYTGVCNGWHVLATAIKGVTAEDGTKYKDKELALLIFTNKPVDPENKQPKPRVSPAIIPLDKLENAKLRQAS